MQRELVLLLGSNIEPQQNIIRAIEELKKHFSIAAVSSVWQSHPVGGLGGDYHNLAVAITTDKPVTEIKDVYIHPIEQELGRVRTDEKNAPRTIDIDVILDEENVIDAKLWRYAFIAIPVSQLKPGLVSPVHGQTLRDFADGLKKVSWLWELPAYPLDLS